MAARADHPAAATRYVSVGGAGTMGNAYFGVLDALEDHLPDYDAWRRGLAGVSGCSAGSVCVLALALGLGRAERRELVDAFDVRRVVATPDLALLARDYGVDRGAGLRACVEAMLVRGGLSAAATLGDLRRLLRIEFACVCTDVDAEQPRPHELSSSATPHVRVADAVAASCAVPLLFCPAVVDGRTLVDGCLSANLPTLFPPAETLFVGTTASLQGRVRDWQDYLCRLAQCCIALQPACGDAFAAAHAGRHVLVDTRRTGLRPIDWSLDRAQCDRLARLGYAAALDALLDGALVPAAGRALRAYVALRRVSADAEEQPPRA
jgi:hypothetical protein